MTVTVLDALANIAAQAVRRFAGHHARVRGSAVVHQVHTERWIAEVVVPAPACRIGVAGWDLLGALTPTDEPVTCARCLRAAHPDQQLPGVEQLALWDARS
ncbi:MAG TPA: hypothetical protein VK453_17800 [Micromonosporaceae bacterium]|nr:hypothetical protein [Micromonosporaceae bacterium]